MELNEHYQHKVTAFIEGCEQKQQVDEALKSSLAEWQGSPLEIQDCTIRISPAAPETEVSALLQMLGQHGWYQTAHGVLAYFSHYEMKQRDTDRSATIVIYFENAKDCHIIAIPQEPETIIRENKLYKIVCEGDPV